MAQPVYIDDTPLLEVELLFAIADITDDDFIVAIAEFEDTIPGPHTNLLTAALVDNTPKRSASRGLFSNLVDKNNVNGIISLYDQGTLNYAIKTKKRYQTVDVKTIEDVVARIESKHYDRIQQLVERRGLGKIKNSEFERLTAKELKSLHTQSYMLGRGGLNAMTSKDKMVLQNLIRDELTYFKKFAQDLRDNKLSMPQFRDRASMYSEKSRGFYEKGREFSSLENGFLVERRVRLSSESCEPCLNYASQSWQPIGTLPTPTYSCNCRSRCKCIKEYSKDLDKLAKPTTEPVNQSGSATPGAPANTPNDAPKNTLRYTDAIRAGEKLIGKELNNFDTLRLKQKKELNPFRDRLNSLNERIKVELANLTLAQLMEGDDMKTPSQVEREKLIAAGDKTRANHLMDLITKHDDLIRKLVQNSSVTLDDADAWMKSVSLESVPFGNRDMWKNEAKLFYRIANGKINTLDTIWTNPNGQSPHASYPKRLINLGQDEREYDSRPDVFHARSLLWHEMSHHIQYSNKGIRDIELDWRTAVAGKDLEFITPENHDNGLGYRSNSFYDQYTGRSYKPLSYKDENGVTRSMEVTEVLTTGAQFLSNPFELERVMADGNFREHLYLTAGLLATKVKPKQ